MKLSVIMPVFNELKTIEAIIGKVDSLRIDKEIVIVDDCSTDGTRRILELKKKNQENGGTGKNFKIIFHQRNQGKGAAIRTGLGYVTGDYVIIQDGDMEYNPEEYLKLTAEVEASHDQVVYGSRFLGRSMKMSMLHWWGNRFLTSITNILYGAKLSDMETCYKLVKTSLFMSLNLKSNQFEIEPEITAKILKKGITIKEVPINYLGREFHQGKKITWRDGFSSLWALIKYRFRD